MGQDIHGFIEIKNLYGLDEWTQILEINYVNRSYSSFGFLGGRTRHNAPNLKYHFLEPDSKCSIDLDEYFLDYWIIHVIYPLDITNYNWDQEIQWESGEKTKASEALSDDFKALFDIIQVLAKHYGNRKVRMIYAFD